MVPLSMMTVFSIAAQVGLVGGEIGWQRIVLNNQILHPAPQRWISNVDPCETLPDDFRLRHIANLGGLGNLFENQLGNLDAHGLHAVEHSAWIRLWQTSSRNETISLHGAAAAGTAVIPGPPMIPHGRYGCAVRNH